MLRTVVIFRSICCFPARLHLIDCILLLPKNATESQFRVCVFLWWGGRGMTDRGWCPKRGRKSSLEHARETTNQGHSLKAAGKGADLISIRRVLLLMRISLQKAEIPTDDPSPLDLCPFSRKKSWLHADCVGSNPQLWWSRAATDPRRHKLAFRKMPPKHSVGAYAWT